MYLSLRTVRIRIMSITNIVEEVELVFRREECCAYRMDRCVSPALFIKLLVKKSEGEDGEGKMVGGPRSKTLLSILNS